MGARNSFNFKFEWNIQHVDSFDNRRRGAFRDVALAGLSCDFWTSRTKIVIHSWYEQWKFKTRTTLSLIHLWIWFKMKEKLKQVYKLLNVLYYLPMLTAIIISSSIIKQLGIIQIIFRALISIPYNPTFSPIEIIFPYTIPFSCLSFVQYHRENNWKEKVSVALNNCYCHHHETIPAAFF